MARREEALEHIKGSNRQTTHEKNILRFALPKTIMILFSGKLQEFKDWKAQRDQITVMNFYLFVVVVVMNQVLQERVNKRKGNREGYTSTTTYKKALGNSV